MDNKPYPSTNFVSFDLIKPTLLRSLPSTQITTYSVHACKSLKTNITEEDEAPQTKRFISKSSSKSSLTNNKPTELSRTQHKLMLQRHSFLADDKNHLDHPENMRRLTKELDRMNREYRNVKQYHDPFILSLQRVKALQQQAPKLQRRASSHTAQGYIRHFEEERRHSFSSVVTTHKPSSSPGFIGRMFGSAI